MEFRRGDRVEVCGRQDGFIGSYYGATIISRIGEGDYIVEYGTLLSDDELGPLREVVGAGDLRPRPAAEFGTREEVDAWDNDGWWRGTVVRRWRKRRRYEIYFEDSGEQKRYNLPDLRAHLDWVDGRWERSIKGA